LSAAEGVSDTVSCDSGDGRLGVRNDDATLNVKSLDLLECTGACSVLSKVSQLLQLEK